MQALRIVLIVGILLAVIGFGSAIVMIQLEATQRALSIENRLAVLQARKEELGNQAEQVAVLSAQLQAQLLQEEALDAYLEKVAELQKESEDEQEAYASRQAFEDQRQAQVAAQQEAQRQAQAAAQQAAAQAAARQAARDAAILQAQQSNSQTTTTRVTRAS